MEIVWRRAALGDLRSVQEFIAEDNPDAAARVHSAIRASVGLLADHPNLGRAGRVEGTRELIIVGLPYIVAYRVVDDQVRILAVVHTSRQWPTRLR